MLGSSRADYTADSSVISDDRGADLFDLTYDAAGRLAEALRNSTLAASYAYDAFGRRVRKDLGASGAVDYHYDPDGRLLAESDGSPEREYVWLPLDGQAWALPLALITDAGTAAPRVHYLHTDHLGTPVAMTSSGLASIEWSAAFRPFGEVHAIAGTDSLALRFPGQLLDPETGFHQNWHRDYDPRLGRYLQSDPIGLKGGLNTYAYVGGRPIDLSDPQGLVTAYCSRLFGCDSGGGGGVGRGTSRPSAAQSARGLPPEGLSPPVARPDLCKPGPASRPSEQRRGGMSLWDQHGGEWRYHPGDRRHNPHWDYNPHNAPNSRWRNVPVGGNPVYK